jgi:hypothetical protein
VKRLLIALTAFTLLAFWLSPSDAGAANGFTCQFGTSSGINTAADPDTFTAISFTTCSGAAEHPDDLTLTVFCDYAQIRFLGSVWRSCGVYDMESCQNCGTVWSETNNNVPIPAFKGMNCRRAVTVHRVWQFFPGSSPVYAWTTTLSQCQ